jgi:transporter family protein
MHWLVYALLTMVFFGITNFSLKVAAHHGMASVMAALVVWLSVGLVGVVFLLFFAHTGDLAAHTENLTSVVVVAPVLAGVALAFGMYFLKRAVAAGPAGPAVAIVASNAVLVAALSYLFFHEQLYSAKIAGIALVLGGIVIMSLSE